jgi:hypothetical protein
MNKLAQSIKYYLEVLRKLQISSWAKYSSKNIS